MADSQNSTQAMCLQQQFDNSANVHFRVAAGVAQRDVLKKWESDKLDRILPNLSLQDPKPIKLKLRGRTWYESVVCFPMKEPLLKLQTFETKKKTQ